MSGTQHTRKYRFLGLDIRVACSSPIAESLDSRFRFLPPDGTPPTETISFDFQSVPDASWHCVQKPREKSRSFYEFPSGEACYFPETDEIYLRLANGVRALASPGLGSASFSIVDSDPANVFVASHLMLTILLVELLKRRNCYSMHAAGFAQGGKALLIPGTSGAGKSTLAVTLLRGRFGYLSDDMVFLRRGSQGLEILGFPEDIDVSDQTIDFFPELNFLKHSTRAAGWSKKQVRADQVYQAELVRQARPGIIVFPQISRYETTSVRQIDPDEALRQMVSNVLLTEPRSCQSHLAILTELVSRTPCYRLETGRDFDRIPVLLRELLNAPRPSERRPAELQPDRRRSSAHHLAER